MGRSYSFEPMKAQQPAIGVQGSGPRLGNNEDTEKLALQQASDQQSLPLQGLSETVKRYQKKAVAKRQAAPPARAKSGTAKKPNAAKKKPTATKKAAPRAGSASKRKPAPAARKGNKAKARPAKKPAKRAK